MVREEVKEANIKRHERDEEDTLAIMFKPKGKFENIAYVSQERISKINKVKAMFEVIKHTK